MSDLKLGRLAPTKPFGVMELGAYSNGRLPDPPAAIASPGVDDWQMFSNDKYGDCTMAGAAHLIMAWDAAFKVNDPVPSDSTVVETYLGLTNGADTGLNEHNVLETWRTSGLFGNKIAAYAPVNPRNLVELHQAIAFYGACYLGIMCPASAQTDFANNMPWAYDPASPIDGGHCIIAVGYTKYSLLCVSWGKLVEVTYPFLAHFLEESWCVISQELVEAKEDYLGLDLATLTADLNRIAA